jgi:phage/plasmid-associated DNA primase
LNERGRFIQPETGKAIGLAMEEQNNPLAKFCYERLEIDPADCAMPNGTLCAIFENWCETAGLHWLRRQIPNNQLVGKIRLVDGFGTVAMVRPHGGKRLYNLKRKQTPGC